MDLNLPALTFRGKNGRDDFKREQVADKVIKLLTSDIHLSPMVIDGDWGMGKTEFCHKLINKFAIDHSNYKLVYVDAFQADHADNPLMTILSAVMAEITDEKQKSKLLQKALPVLRYTLETVGKAVVSHVLKKNADDVIEGLDKTIQDAADKAIDASVRSLLKDHEKSQENLAALQNTLQSIAESSPIVIFIDELDRCRPDYAVQMLEVIKHTFRFTGVQFLLVTNTKQLKAAINHRYGQQVDAQRYLDKFLKFSFRLPDFIPGITRRGGRPQLAASEHFSKLVEASSTLKNTDIAEKHNIIHEFTESLLSANNVSLREVETFIRYLEIYQNLSDGLDSNLGYQMLRIFGVFIYFFDPEVAESIQNNNTDAIKITALLKINKIPDYKETNFLASNAMTIAIAMAQSSDHNNANFMAKEKIEKEYWDEKIHTIFRDAWGNQTPDNIFAPIKDAITHLSFGGK